MPRPLTVKNRKLISEENYYRILKYIKQHKKTYIASRCPLQSAVASALETLMTIKKGRHFHTSLFLC